MASETTTASDLIIPEVWGAAIGLAVPGRAVMAPFATVDNTLQGQPGDTITFSKFAYIGDAVDLAEDDVIETRKLTMTSASMGIKEAGTGISITDKAVLTAMGNPQDQAVDQLTLSVARKIDGDLRAAAAQVVTADPANGVAASSPLIFNAAGNLDYDAIVDATTLLGDEWDPAAQLGLLVHSRQYASLRRDPMFLSADKVGANNTAILTGRVGQISGVDIVVSDRTTRTGAGTVEDPFRYQALMIRRGALTLAYKRQAIVEKARDIEARKTIITTNVHYGVQRTDDNGVIVINTGAAVAA